MTTHASSSGQALVRALSRVARRIRFLAGLGGLGLGLAAATAGLFALGWLDLLRELPEGARAWGLRGAAALAAAIVIGITARAWGSSARHGAARAVDRAGGTGGQILSGLELLEASPAERPMTEGLRRLAVGRAAEVARGVAPAAVAPLGKALRPYRLFAAALAAVAVVAIASPRLAHTQALRTLAPWADVPPYTPYVFKVEPGNAEILYGGTLDVSVRFEDKKPEQLEMLVDAGQGAPEILPMFPEADGAWRGQLRDLSAPVTYTLRTPRGRSRAYNVSIIYTPEIVKAVFRVTPPAYTGLAPSEGPMPEQGLSGIAGTTVECFVTSNRPLSGGDLTLTSDDGEKVAGLKPSSDDARTVEGSFEITRGGRFSLGVRDATGLDGRTRVSGAVTLLDDKRPYVRISEPVQLSLATPTAVLPVVVEADDDYGITGLWLYRSLNDSRDLPLKLTPEGGPSPRVKAEVELPLALYKLSPGDILAFYARALDNDPNSPKGAESELVRVVIIIQEEFDRLTQARATLEDLLSKYYSQDRALEALADRIEEDLKALEELDPEDAAAVEAMRKELSDLAQALRDQAQSARDAAAQDPLFDADKSLARTLEDLARAMDQAAGKVGEAGNAAPGALASKSLKEAKEALEGARGRFGQEAMAPLEALEKAYPLIEDAARFSELYLRQEELARRMKSLSAEDLSTPEARVRMGDLAEEQAQVREEVAQLLDDIRAHEAQCPEGEGYDEVKATARKFVEDYSASGADEEMGAAGTALSQLEAGKGAERSERAAKIMSSFVSRCQGMASQGQQALAFQPSVQEMMGATVAQLLASAGYSALQGSGAGASGAGGYSMNQSTLDNVGLYGASRRETPSSGGGDKPRTSQGVSITLSSEGSDTGGLVTANEETASSAAILQSVPPEYRSRVQEYFRTVAEETSKRQPRR